MRNRISTRSCQGLLVIALATLMTLFVTTACNQAQHPDVKDDVNNAMTRNDLGVVKVSQDRDKGVITLTGDVDSPEKKALAESVATQAAPGYAISNELGVRPVGNESQAKAVDSNLDSAIQDNYKAALKAHKNLDDQSISYDAKNGTLVLKGSVKTQAQKKEATLLAKNVPNVKEVVNEIEVKPDKNSTNQ
ncbi:MAG TPA: BON domain-containing protein [Terriglobales bacterium]|nr:BON domain-containing protein [Terriglobales bacterium]